MTPAAETPAAETPDAVVFRPRRLRLMMLVAVVGLVAITTVGWLALPSAIRRLFSWSQRLTLLGVLAVLIIVIAAVALSYVRADDQGLRLRNGLRSHTVPWHRVHKVILRPGDPWAILLVKSPGLEFDIDIGADKRMLMGIQAHDGPVAVEAVAELGRRLRVSQSRGT